MTPGWILLLFIELLGPAVCGYQIEDNRLDEKTSSWSWQQQQQQQHAQKLHHSGWNTTSNSHLTYISNSHLTYILNSRLTCSDDLYFLVLVHSAPDNFQRRMLIRESWGSLHKLEGRRMKVVFLLGEGVPSRPHKYTAREKTRSKSLNSKVGSFFPNTFMEDDGMKGSSVQRVLELEQSKYGDLVQATFPDTPSNQAVKQLMGFRWAQEHCSHRTRFIVNVDDNVFTEMYHLYHFVDAFYSQKGEEILACDVVPSEAQSKSGSWDPSPPAESAQPEYCRSSAFIITPGLLPRFIQEAEEIPQGALPGDVYLTGVLRDRVGVNPLHLNLRYSYDETGARRWLSSKFSAPLPYLFVIFNSPQRQWTGLVKDLWKRSKKIQYSQK